jgi:hypothetical protein
MMIKINYLIMKTVFLNIQKVSFTAGLLFYAIFNGATLSAQDLVLQGLDSVEAVFHIKYEIPEGFNNLNAAQSWQPENSSPWRILCWVFESKDRQCRVLYDVFPWYTAYTGYTHRDRMCREFKSMLNTDNFVLDNYLRILPSKEAQKRFNADSIFLYDVPTAAVPDTGDEKFTHCIRMFIVRQDRAILDLLWYFTEKGKKREKKYMQKINKQIWYNDGHWNWDRQRWEEWMKTCFKELMEGKKHILNPLINENRNVVKRYDESLSVVRECGRLWTDCDLQMPADNYCNLYAQLQSHANGYHKETNLFFCKS